MLNIEALICQCLPAVTGFTLAERLPEGAVDLKLSIGQRKGGAHSGLGADGDPVTDRFGEVPDQMKAKSGLCVEAAAVVI